MFTWLSVPLLHKLSCLMFGLVGDVVGAPDVLVSFPFELE